ncbi:hypothetical protein CHGG_03602 [Chaetomium globosum CBS 148.51]|uniref:Cyclin n=1 Tax=Chaetomium globosum (strain ATCC 6205 / CBS 148.51 / DSM 1962 / NBRC 6347 / NRRL 1970) TaxID=306901 RepID=Q2H852_CHAGB|nr:uncharacterized protein CHGG_03602 [Chaetomium globosum CBS 148.51]EAQ91667.1 hypothetical protein CHGG_03602 [Chaetomium globosum CBS 148.51]
MAQEQFAEQSTSGRENGNGHESSPLHSPSPARAPSADPELQGHARPDHALSPATVDHGDETFKVSAEAALKLLSAGIEALVSMTGDIPPTPPPMSPTIPHMRGMDAEKINIVRSNSEKNLARLAQRSSAATSPMPGRSPLQHVQSASDAAETLTTTSQPQEVDGVRLRTTNPAPAAAPGHITCHLTTDAPAVQSPANAIPTTARTVHYLPPPISVTEYLSRVHNYCPLSAAVYLATSLYIHRLAVLERAIVVTKRNAHRLVLAGLRVAMKALEDTYYSHDVIARVGGISGKELGRLEISFCFLTSFDLAVDASMLKQHWELLQKGTECWSVLEEELRQQDRGFVSFVKAPPEGGAEAQA